MGFLVVIAGRWRFNPRAREGATHMHTASAAKTMAFQSTRP